MRLIRVTLHNAFSYEKATLDFDKHPFLLIKGENGSGKTSLLEAICFALYGQTIKLGSTREEIIRASKKEGWCELEFEVDGKIYCVKRIRTQTGGRIKITEDGKKVHIKSLKQGDLYLEELVGVPYSVFKQSAIYGQGDNQRFVNTPDSERKKFLSDVLSLGKLKNAYANAREIHKDFSAKADRSMARIETLSESVDSYTPSLAAIERRGISARLKNLRKKIESTSVRRDEVGKKLAKAGSQQERLAELEHDIASKKRKLSSMETITCDANELKEGLRRTNDEIAKVRNSIAEISDAIVFGKSKLDNLETGIADKEKKVEIAQSGICPECGREYDNPSEAIIALENDIANDRKIMDSLKADIEQMGEERRTYTERSSFLSEKASNFTEQLTESGNYFALENSLEELRNKRDELLEVANPLDIEDLASEMEQLSEWLDSARIDAESLVSKLNELARVKSNCLEIEKENKKLERYKHFVAQSERLMSVFGKSGVQHKLVELVLPEFEELTNKYLKTIDNSGLSVEYRGFQKRKDGSIRDKLDVMVCKGTEVRKFESFSGGEKKRILVASSLAEADIVARYTLLDFFLADEPFSELDETGKFGLARLFELLHERFENVVVITHDERIQSIFTDVVEVVKEGGISQICES